MLKPTDILHKYWGYTSFRPVQEEIILSVLEGHDTLALLPTGGGKSICFQVPALCMEKLCLVISPLIALMKDQVENLTKRGIGAAMISSSMNEIETMIVYEKCCNKELNFLYVSPERIQSPRFIELLENLEIGIIAIDEAHCISQWGYDFRPAYLEIAKIRSLFPETPLIALTATATPEVCKEIEIKLHFRNGKRFKKSFVRENLAYIVRRCDDKNSQLIRILQKIPGSSIVYVRSRKKTREIADFLTQSGISASYYHAGLDGFTRGLRQTAWVENKIRTIVCTNAFGMGIDKPNVRTVIHMEMPDSPEAYFQEAGRAGRDEKKSWAVLLTDNPDTKEALDRFENKFPGFDQVKAIYNWICNHYHLPVGAGEGQTYPFDPAKFAENYKINSVQLVEAIRFIEREGLLTFHENSYSPAKLIFLISPQDLYEFEFRNPSYEPLIKTLIRSYSGIFRDFIPIREQELADRCGLKFEKIIEQLKYLDKAEIISYYPVNSLPLICFTAGRQHPDRLPISKRNYELRKEDCLKRLHAMIQYADNNQKCRSRLLIEYFGEINSRECGTCDVCIENKKREFPDKHTDKIIEEIAEQIKNGYQTTDLILKNLSHNPEVVIGIIRRMIDENMITEGENGKLKWGKGN